jgi:carbamate kinase
MYAKGENRQLIGVEAVIDKDLATSLLARDLKADLYIMATDVDGVYADWGTPDQRRLDRVTPEELGAMEFAAGSMGPKVQAAVEFAGATGKRAVIGSLEEIDGLVAGTAGTNVTS